MAIGIIPEIPSSREQENVIDFDDLELSKIELADSGKKEEGALLKHGLVQLAIEGRKFPLFVEYKEIPDSKIIARFYICKPGTQAPPPAEEGGLLSAHAVFALNDPTKDFLNSVTTNITRVKKSELPEGLGILMYGKVLDFIQHEARSLQKELTHIVNHDPHEGLNSEKWARIFRPILIERGYERNYNLNQYEVGEKWQKEYKPEI